MKNVLNLEHLKINSDRYGVYMKSGHDARGAWLHAQNDLVYARSNVPDYDELADDEGKYCDGLCLNKLLLLQTGHIMAVRGIEATETAKFLEEVSKQEAAANDNKYDRDKYIKEAMDYVGTKDAAVRKALEYLDTVPPKEREKVIAEYEKALSKGEFKKDPPKKSWLEMLWRGTFGANDAEANAAVFWMSEEVLIFVIAAYSYIKSQQTGPIILSTPIHDSEVDIETFPESKPLNDVETFPVHDEDFDFPGFGFPDLPDDMNVEIFPEIDGNINLIFEFEIDGKKFQEHHIISDTNQNTNKVKKLWEKAGMDIQSRDNKIFLPTEPDHHPTRSLHKGRHWNSVSEELADKMKDNLEIGEKENWSQEQYKAALTEILKEERANLKSGNRALNKNMREWSDDKGKK